MFKPLPMPVRWRSRAALFFCIGFLFAGFRTLAQDSLFIAEEGKNLYIPIRVQHGDDLFLLSKRFKAPPAKVAALNGLSYQSGLRRGSYLKIPVGKYNYITINSAVSSQPVYYKVKEGESLRQVSRKFSIPQSSVQRWNNLSEPEVFAGQVIQAGWIRYDSSQVAFADDKNPEEEELTASPNPRRVERKNPRRGDSLRKEDDTLSAADGQHDSTTAYERQFYKATAGRQIQERSGAVVFYTLEARVEEGVYYALFDGVPGGAIVEITNPSNGKVIYAKTIGGLPDINDYRNAVMGLSNNAVRDLGATSRRIFCRIRYY